ncbi:Vesicle-associated protein 2-1 [Ranunculus cassubicifolius]
MTTGGGNQLISVHPEELTFQFELEKQCYCELKVANNTEHHVAFKVKTTSPKKYFVRPNTGVIQPWDSYPITVTLQAQHEYPPDMQCKDKFLLQSTVVPAHTDVDELPAETFNREGDRVIEDCKLRVVYKSSTGQQTSEADQYGARNSNRNLDTNSTEAVQRVKEERDAAVRQTHRLQQELDLLRRRRNRNSDPGFSLTFAAFVGLVGIVFGFILNLTFSSPPSTE